MPAPQKKFRKPAKPQSLKRIARKVMADPEYGKFLHRHIKKARKGDKDATKTVEAHYKPAPKELSWLKSKFPGINLAACTETTKFALLDWIQHV